MGLWFTAKIARLNLLPFVGCVFQFEKDIVIFEGLCLNWTITLNLVSRQTVANLENKLIPWKKSVLMGIGFIR